MKSTIKIDIAGIEPVIRISREDTTDLRDKFIGSFLERLQHSSNLCFIEYTGTPGIWDIHSLPVDGDGWYSKIPTEQQFAIAKVIIPLLSKEQQNELLVELGIPGGTPTICDFLGGINCKEDFAIGDTSNIEQVFSIERGGVLPCRYQIRDVVYTTTIKEGVITAVKFGEGTKNVLYDIFDNLTSKTVEDVEEYIIEAIVD